MAARRKRPASDVNGQPGLQATKSAYKISKPKRVIRHEVAEEAAEEKRLVRITSSRSVAAADNRRCQLPSALFPKRAGLRTRQNGRLISQTAGGRLEAAKVVSVRAAWHNRDPIDCPLLGELPSEILIQIMDHVFPKGQTLAVSLSDLFRKVFRSDLLLQDRGIEFRLGNVGFETYLLGIGLVGASVGIVVERYSSGGFPYGHVADLGNR